MLSKPEPYTDEVLLSRDRGEAKRPGQLLGGGGKRVSSHPSG